MAGSFDAHKVLRGLAGAELREQPPEQVCEPHTVTLSRAYMAGGEEVAQTLARELNVPLYDGELLEAIVREAQCDKYLMERLDERVHGLIDDWIAGLILGHSVTHEDYRRHLVSVVLSISQQGGVIVGRGAHIILANGRSWRVRVTGTPEVCARRLAQRDSCSEAEALQTVSRINAVRAEFLRMHFDREIEDSLAYDLVINTDKIGILEAADISLFGIRHASSRVPAAP